jgi:hypothetical protein
MVRFAGMIEVGVHSANVTYGPGAQSIALSTST